MAPKKKVAKVEEVGGKKMELLKQNFAARMQYARFKVEKGWETKEIGEVEGIWNVLSGGRVKERERGRSGSVTIVEHPDQSYEPNEDAITERRIRKRKRGSDENEHEKPDTPKNYEDFWASLSSKTLQNNTNTPAPISSASLVPNIQSSPPPPIAQPLTGPSSLASLHLKNFAEESERTRTHVAQQRQRTTVTNLSSPGQTTVKHREYPRMYQRDYVGSKAQSDASPSRKTGPNESDVVRVGEQSSRGCRRQFTPSNNTTLEHAEIESFTSNHARRRNAVSPRPRAPVEHAEKKMYREMPQNAPSTSLYPLSTSIPSPSPDTSQTMLTPFHQDQREQDQVIQNSKGTEVEEVLRHISHAPSSPETVDPPSTIGSLHTIPSDSSMSLFSTPQEHSSLGKAPSYTLPLTPHPLAASTSFTPQNGVFISLSTSQSIRQLTQLRKTDSTATVLDLREESGYGIGDRSSQGRYGLVGSSQGLSQSQGLMSVGELDKLDWGRDTQSQTQLQG